MEVEETTVPVVESSDENNAKKGKILSLLFPSEAVPAEGKEGKKDKNKPFTKVVIRRLPPRLTKEAFLEEFSPLPAHDYFYFVRGDLSLGSNSFSRAYINFINQDDIFTFKEKYDDYGVQDDKGKIYHAVVEFAPFQRIPRRNSLKKKLSKAGTLESDPKYLEFLKKLEEYKNNTTNSSEYFHETENLSLKTKITTTPLLEYLKAKKQKKNDLKNDIRAKKRELEKERKKKEEERRKAERERKKEEKKNSRYEDKNKVLDEKSRKSDERLKDNKKNEIRSRSKDDKLDMRYWKVVNSSLANDKSDVLISSDPAILQVVLRQSDKSPEKNGNNENILIKSRESNSNLIKNEKKFSDFRTRVVEERQKKSFHKRDSDEKSLKANSRSRKGVPDEKGDNCNIGNCSDAREYGKKSENDMDLKKSESKTEQKEAKSKFRYSEQRNREREYRSQKSSDWKKDSSKVKTDGKKGEGSKEIAKEDTEPVAVAVKSRRRSLEFEKNSGEEVRKRSRSLHDVSMIKDKDFRLEKKSDEKENETGQLDDGSKESNGSEKAEDEIKKDTRAERRIRNKDRPSMEIYRPGMGKFSKQRLEQKKDESNASGSCNPVKNNRVTNKISLKKLSVEHKTSIKADRGEEKTSTKTSNEVRTMTFSRSGSKEN